MEHYADLSVVPLLELAAPQLADVALDYGCGAGQVAFAFAPLVGRVDAVDRDPDTLAEAERLGAEQGLTNVAFAAADLLGLPAADGSYNLVLARNALHTLQEPERALAEMRRVARPDGRIVLCEAVADNANDRYLNELARLREPAHWRYHPAVEYQAMFKAAGLQEVKSQRPRRTVDLDSWARAGTGSEDSMTLIRSRLSNYPVLAQLALDVGYSDRAVSFAYDVLVVLLAAA